jgi:hypothetical protein
MKRFATFLGVFVLFLLWGFSSLADAQSVSFTGLVKNNSGQAVSGATIEQVGSNPLLSTTSDPSGNFTLAGLPSGTPFSLRISKTNFVDAFTNNMSSTQNFASTRPYTLYAPADVSQWSITPGKGVIVGKVFDQANPQTNLDGAVVSAASGLHPGTPYTVVYPQDAGPPAGTSTAANGRYMVLNVDDTDTVTVTATKAGWTIQGKVFVTHAGAISQGALPGTSSGGVENTLSLAAGWNFVSFPKQPTDNAIASALADVLSDVLVVFGFDNELKTWKQYRPAAGDNTLATIEQGKGYWIYLSADGTIDISTWTSVSSQVHLDEGWNLVGYSGTDGTAIATSFVSVSGWQVIWTWVSGTWKAAANGVQLPIPPVSTFKQGRAYWIKMGTGASADWSQ